MLQAVQAEATAALEKAAYDARGEADARWRGLLEAERQKGAAAGRALEQWRKKAPVLLAHLQLERSELEEVRNELATAGAQAAGMVKDMTEAFAAREAAAGGALATEQAARVALAAEAEQLRAQVAAAAEAQQQAQTMLASASGRQDEARKAAAAALEAAKVELEQANDLVVDLRTELEAERSVQAALVKEEKQRADLAERVAEQEQAKTAAELAQAARDLAEERAEAGRARERAKAQAEAVAEAEAVAKAAAAAAREAAAKDTAEMAAAAALEREGAAARVAALERERDAAVNAAEGENASTATAAAAAAAAAERALSEAREAAARARAEAEAAEAALKAKTESHDKALLVMHQDHVEEIRKLRAEQQQQGAAAGELEATRKQLAAAEVMSSKLKKVGITLQTEIIRHRKTAEDSTAKAEQLAAEQFRAGAESARAAHETEAAKQRQQVDRAQEERGRLLLQVDSLETEIRRVQQRLQVRFALPSTHLARLLFPLRLSLVALRCHVSMTSAVHCKMATL
jgi:hypothetical protein